MGWFASWMLNPLFLGIGALAIASPIIIHLLNRRRFKIVDWAAMRFLLDADKKNRKRVRLENLILLMLRCLAMILLGLMIARPFVKSTLASLFGEAQRFERIVLLDDSLSQQVIVDNKTQFERSLDDLRDMISKVAHDENVDFLTLYVTSRPAKPVMTNEPVTPETVGALSQMLDDVKCSDQQALYREALQEVQRYLGDESTDVNRMLYIVSDLRKVDWGSPDQLAAENAPNKLVNEIAETIAQVDVVDVGSETIANLAVIDIRPVDLLVANTNAGFAVTVANYGEKSVENVQVKFHEGDNPAQTESIAVLAPGKTETIVFRYLFQFDMEQYDESDLQDQLQSNGMYYKVSAEVVHDGMTLDHLVADSSHFYAAQVFQGIPILIVDGEPSPIPIRSESYYLERIKVNGTGVLVDVVTASELATVSLTKYKVIYLCNVDEASTDRITSLEQWVSDGGGLVLMPGGVVRANRFNASFFKDGEGLSPIKLTDEQGDPTENSWVNFEVTDTGHPALRVAKDRDVDLEKVEVFSWWGATVLEDQLNKTVSVAVRLNNESSSPAMVEKSFGKGKVLAFTIPADIDWSNWPAHPTFISIMWDMVFYLASNDGTQGSVTVGNKVTHPVDLSRYDLRVGLSDPSQQKVESTAVAPGDSEEDRRSVIYQVSFDILGQRGFYDLSLKKKSGETDSVLYAANVDAFESDLKRLDILAMGDGFFTDKVKLISSSEMSGKADSRTSNSLWPRVLLLLAGILGLEQFLGWWFGKRR